MPPLSKLETVTCVGIWIGGIFVSLYKLHLYGEVFSNNFRDEYHSEDFKSGWSILGQRYQDQSDYEWQSWTELTYKLLPYLACNLIVAELIRKSKKFFLLPIWYSFITLSFIICNYNILLTLWFVSLTLIYYVLQFFRSRILIWSVTFLVLHFLHPESWSMIDENEQYLVMISSSWIILRCISYSIDNLDQLMLKKKTFRDYVLDLASLLGYSLYLPTLFCGPFILFSSFNTGIHSEFEKWNLERLQSTILKFVRCMIWYLFTQFSLHFIYVNAILLRPHLVHHFTDWELAGLGIAMGHFFYLKYIVFYGLPCAWAAAERFTTPDPPCCVSRINLYSQMWRRFDHGLYQFLVKYIYIPITSSLKSAKIFQKVVASVICFAFVFSWHREENYVFYWVSFNSIALCTEAFAKHLYNTPKIHKFFQESISQSNKIRMQCALAAPLHYFSMVSNFFFIGNGMDVGMVFLNKFLYGSCGSMLTVLFFLYGAGHSAVAAQHWEEKKRAKLKSK